MDVTAVPTIPSNSSSYYTEDADEVVAALLSATYGGDISNLDAITGALAERAEATEGGFFGPLLHAAWVEQMLRWVG